MEHFSELKSSGLDSLAGMPHPVATVYLNLSGGAFSRHKHALGQLAWLRKQAKLLAGHLSSADRTILLEQVRRIERFFREHRLQRQGLVIFAGSAAWKVYVLPDGVENELHWGRPALGQLFFFLNRHKQYCAVIVDRSGAQLYRYASGELIALEGRRFQADVKDWRKKDLGHVSRPGIRKTRGSQRDTFEHRMDAQYQRFFRELAHEAELLCRHERLSGVFLVGSERMTRPIRDSFSPAMGKRAVCLDEDVANFPRPALLRRLEKGIEAWESEGEANANRAPHEGAALSAGPMVA
jgi:Bacterial archaeo-eukaryotic release factor family 10